MTPAELLRALRARGYAVRLVGGKLRIEGRSPHDPEGTARLVSEQGKGVAAVLGAEAHPAVLAALAAFPGARLREVRAATPEPTPFPSAARGEPTGWRTVAEFKAHLAAIGARLYRDPIGLVCIAPTPRFTPHVAAGLRIYRAELMRDAEPVTGEVREPRGWEWLRV